MPGYEILGILGHGGMGVVYRARQLKANRLVALKMIRAVEHATPQERLRFQIETEAVARLQHPHIVQLYEVGEVRGQPFFSLEFCDGGTLTEQLKKQRPTPRQAAELIETLARAMHYAHLRGVVHRDLKPGNVLLAGAERVPKITDFGLAKRIDAEARDVSKSGAIMGTASYMAPEQAAGKVHDTGPGADVYALGALLYECLTGRPPFEGPQHVVLVSVLNDEPVPPSRLGAKVPRDLETVCLKCLSKEPARRYASAEELANDLRRFQAGEPVQARPVGRIDRAVKWARRRPALAALLGVTLFALVALAALTGSLAVARSEAETKEQEARQQAERANKARDFLVSIFRISEKDTLGGNITARHILAQAEQRIPVEFADQPELRAELVKAIREVKRAIGRRTPQAMILEVRGTVQLQSAAGVQKAVPQTLLYLDDRLTLAADAGVQLVFLSDLHKERLQPGREVTIDFKGCEPADAVLERDSNVLMTFVRLPKGAFHMGGGGGKAGTKTEITEDFEIAVHTVTQGQWQAVMGNNPSYFSRKGRGRNEILDISDEELKLFPVECVSWHDVQEFLNKLNEQERGRGYRYRLPTEAEWEYACRGGATSEEECSYHFYFDRPTNDLSSEEANFNGAAPFGTGLKGKYLARSTRVGAYPSNKMGLCDMHGNVCQWCADLSLLFPNGSERAYRGGSCMGAGYYCRAANRFGGAPTDRFNNHGFRLARIPVR
ncbi:MAG TPA: bifunctional serine/threonine-protein kinase/formylglycine-generating enzyme family protein [Gemmataceae bacterium]|nr:bifunctional serine/threonine-protein kinase/formylglycine-generating enzyme family protein [Gemmataceae bacterium]